MRALAITRVNLIRFFHNRSAIFTVFVLPFLIVLLLGASAGGASTPRVGFHAATPDAFTTQLFAALDSVGGLDVVEIDREATAVRQVERGELQAAMLLPDGYESSLRSGGDGVIRFVTRTAAGDQDLTRVIQAVVTQQATLLRTARYVVNEGFGTFEQALAVGGQLSTELPPVSVDVVSAGEPFVLAGLGQFDVYAQNMLVLFIFITTLSGAVTLVQSRQLGITRRMYSTPTTAGETIVGEGLSRFALAMFQGLLIFVGTWLLFGVDWGNPWGSALTIIVFALASSGAAMLLGSLVSNERQANTLATTLGLVLAALGGAMVALAVLKELAPTVYKVAHITPHAWALEAFQRLIAERGGIGDIAGFLLILLGYAVVFFALASWRLRVVLTR